MSFLNRERWSKRLPFWKATRPLAIIEIAYRRSGINRMEIKGLL